MNRPPGNLDNKATLSISGKGEVEVSADDLVEQIKLGEGAYGVVHKVMHAPSGTLMAVKVR